MSASRCSQCLLAPDAGCQEPDCPRRMGPQIGEIWSNRSGRRVQVTKIEHGRVAFQDVTGEGSGFMLGVFFKQQFTREGQA